MADRKAPAANFQPLPHPEGKSLSGWCMDGHCLPSATSRGCPETFPTAPTCDCPCHRGKIPERAVQVARNDNIRADRLRAVRASLEESGSTPNE